MTTKEAEKIFNSFFEEQYKDLIDKLENSIESVKKEEKIKMFTFEKFEDVLNKKIDAGEFDNITFTHERKCNFEEYQRIYFYFEQGNISVLENFEGDCIPEITISVSELTNEHFRLIMKIQKIIQEIK